MESVGILMDTFVAGVTRHNTCPNPSCKNNVTGWGGGSTPAQQTGLTGFDRTTGARYTSGTFMLTPTGVAVPGVSYTASVQMRPNGNAMGNHDFYVAFTRSAGGDDQSNVFHDTGITANTVARRSHAVTAPALTTGIYIIIDGANAGAIGSIDFVACIYELTSTFTTYFDGDTLGATWDGTNGNSASSL